MSLALPAALAACLGVQPGEIAWPGSRIWQSAPAEDALAGDRTTADPSGANLVRELELAQGRATLPERPVLAEAPRRPEITAIVASSLPERASPGSGPESGVDPADPGPSSLDTNPAAGPVVLRVIPGIALLPPGSASTVQAKHEYQLYFELGSSDLDEPAMRVLHQLIGNALLIRPSRILVIGHADRSGSAALNQELSRKRAQTVATRLEEAGVPLERIEIRALGEDGLAVPTGDGAPDPGNRRVAVRLM